MAGKIGAEVEMSKERIKELEEKLADLKARWPAHSVPVSMWQEFEGLEDELERAKKEAE
jgi:hypothetical protein